MVSLRGLTLTAARPRIIVPLFARDPAALCPLAKAASADPAAELVELRLDPLPADEPHLHDTSAEASVTRYLEDRGRLAGFKFG